MAAEIRTPLGRARGMGSAKHGVGHFIAQRVTAVALLLLIVWGLAASLQMAHGDFDSAAKWLASPVNAGLACLIAVAGFWHMSIGMRVIIEDYIARTSTKTVLLVLNVFIAWLGGALTILAILKVALTSVAINT